VNKYELIRLFMAAVLVCTEAYRDFKKHKVSVLFITIIAALGVVTYIPSMDLRLISVSGGMIIGLGVMLTAFFTKQKIGYGDGYMLMATGILLGFRDNMAMFLISLIYCSIFGLGLMFFRKAGKNTEIPFVPFMIPGLISLEVITWINP